MAERRRSLQEQFSQPAMRRSVGEGEDGVIQAGTVGSVRGLLESSQSEVAKSFAAPPRQAHGTAGSKFRAALQGLSGGGGLPPRGPVQRSKSCTSMQPLWDNLLNDDAAPKFMCAGTAVGIGQVRKGCRSSEFELPAKSASKSPKVSGARSRLEAAEARGRSGERGRHDAELEMVRASRSCQREGDDLKGVDRGFDGQQRIRLELEALRMNRRRMIQEEEDEVDEDTKMSERDRIQGSHTGFHLKSNFVSSGKENLEVLFCPPNPV